MEAKKIQLHHIHERTGAKIVPFAGFLMPLRYTSDIEEHLTVRNGVGVFDVSHMGEFIVKGPQALELIQYISSNDAGQLFPGKVQYAYMPNNTGGIVDDLLVYQISETEYMLVVNASNIDKDLAWIRSHSNGKDVEIRNISDELSLLAIQGPKSIEALQVLTDVNLSAMQYYTFIKGTFAGIPDIIISATGYTGASGFEIYIPNEHAEHIWNSIFEAGSAVGIQPVGLAARDTLRLEMGYCLYGNDIDDTTSPIEAGLGWVTKFNKRFVNSENLLKQKENGVSRKLAGFVMEERGIPRGHYEIQDIDGKNIGYVTSGTQSPSLSKGIGLGYVTTEVAKPGTEIYINIRQRPAKATIVKLPIYKK